MIVYDVATKVLDIETFPQHIIPDLISGITFIVSLSQEKPLRWKEKNTHFHAHTHTRTHAHTHTHTHTHSHNKHTCCYIIRYVTPSPCTFLWASQNLFQLTLAYSNSTTETQEKGLKYIPSYMTFDIVLVSVLLTFNIFYTFLQTFLLFNLKR